MHRNRREGPGKEMSTAGENVQGEICDMYSNSVLEASRNL